MAATWDKRVDFIVRYMYDIDNNGFLDQNDFECMAVRSCVIEGKGSFCPNALEEKKKLMNSLWDEISAIADDDKDGKISNEEFKDAVRRTCVGKNFDEFPQTIKAFIETVFKLLDINQDGIIGIEEFRYNCITRIPTTNIETIDNAFEKLLNDDDKKVGGISIERYKELYKHFIGDLSTNHPAINLFGPL